MDRRKGIATIHSHRLGDVETIRQLLADIENAYNNIYVFELLTDTEFLREFEYSRDLSRQAESLRNYLSRKKGSFHRTLMAEFFNPHPLAYFANQRDIWGFSNVKDLEAVKIYVFPHLRASKRTCARWMKASEDEVLRS